MSVKVSAQQRANARRLRREMTDAERLVWSRIRGHRLNGIGFRRQSPVLGYIADFLCHEAMLIVEIDGGQHNHDSHARRDAARDAALGGAGFRVLRFYNAEVFAEFESVIATIYHAALDRMPEHPDRQALSETPSLPSPARAGEGSARRLRDG